MTRAALFLALMVPTCVMAQDGRRHDASITQVSVPQPQAQVLTSDQISRIATQEEAMRDIRDRMTNIEQSVKDIKADVRVLMETNIIVHFLVQCLTLLIPGLLIASFTVWLTRRPKRRTPPPKPASVSL
jgi:hypothetical protein